MNSSYVQALEMKARWLRWLKERGWQHTPPDARQIIPAYEQVLQTRDTHFMNGKFCSLVDHARRTVPDNLKFDMAWTHDRMGWLWLETPFECPRFVVEPDKFKTKLDPKLVARMDNQVPDRRMVVKISAIGWLPVSDITELPDGRRFGQYGGGKTKATAFLLFHESGEGFGMWSYFTLTDGDECIERIRNFESTAQKEGGAYQSDRVTDELHEIRWIYTAFYLMSQRLAVKREEKPDRAYRRRAEREGRRSDEAIKVISLRRLEADKEKAEREKRQVEWKWQWEVRGHWRNQFYRASGEYHPVFIEAYIKGPADKPLKDPGQKLFVAVR